MQSFSDLHYNVDMKDDTTNSFLRCLNINFNLCKQNHITHFKVNYSLNIMCNYQNYFSMSNIVSCIIYIFLHLINTFHFFHCRGHIYFIHQNHIQFSILYNQKKYYLNNFSMKNGNLYNQIFLCKLLLNYIMYKF